MQIIYTEEDLTTLLFRAFDVKKIVFDDKHKKIIVDCKHKLPETPKVENGKKSIPGFA